MGQEYAHFPYPSRVGRAVGTGHASKAKLIPTNNPKPACLRSLLGLIPGGGAKERLPRLLHLPEWELGSSGWLHTPSVAHRHRLLGPQVPRVRCLRYRLIQPNANRAVVAAHLASVDVGAGDVRGDCC